MDFSWLVWKGVHIQKCYQPHYVSTRDDGSCGYRRHDTHTRRDWKKFVTTRRFPYFSRSHRPNGRLSHGHSNVLSRWINRLLSRLVGMMILSVPFVQRHEKCKSFSKNFFFINTKEIMYSRLRTYDQPYTYVGRYPIWSQPRRYWYPVPQPQPLPDPTIVYPADVTRPENQKPGVCGGNYRGECPTGYQCRGRPKTPYSTAVVYQCEKPEATCPTGGVCSSGACCYSPLQNTYTCC